MTIEALKTRNIEIKGIIFNRLSQTPVTGEKMGTVPERRTVPIFSLADNERIYQDNQRIVQEISGQKVLGELPYCENLDTLYEKFVSIL